MKTKFKLLIFLSLFITSVFSLNRKDFGRKFERAETLYQGGNYAEALNIYLELYKSDSLNSNICFKIGACYVKTGKQNKKAIYYLQKVTKIAGNDYKENDKTETRAPQKAHKFLADAYHLNYDFDLAIASYSKYKVALQKSRPIENDVIKEVTRKIEICGYAKELVTAPVDVKIVNMGPSINTTYADYSPRLSADQSTMIFTSRRPENTGGKTYDGGQYFEDIYISKRSGATWTKAENIGSPINTVGNEAAIGISADGQEILLYKDDFGNGNIYSSTLEGNKWSVPVKLNANINSQWWEPCAFLSADGSTLYFVSDRPGGYGGTDIYKSKKTKLGDWGRAVNLGPTVNSAYDEYAPFIHPDGVTLFYSSKGHKTMGGFDVFFSRTLLNDEKAWLEPANVGYPINSTGDDAFFMVSPDKKRGYYSSFREEGLGEKDNYMIVYPEVAETQLALIKGVVFDANEEAAKNVKITVTNNETNQTGEYRSNSQTGEYLLVLTPGNYNISYESEGLLFYSVNQYVAPEKGYNEKRQDVKLKQIAVGSKLDLNNIFFDFDETKLRPSSKVELDKLYDVLMSNPKLSVEVRGYADSKGTDEYNKKLSFERAQSVVNYLALKGIDKSRILAKAYGKDMATATDDKQRQELAGQGVSSSDRRVELKITGIK
ncbi:MAG: PD40 domain-containing protein [Bacteroidetes bacterium]|nr:PD40 domain-containing protein [Bacteroidota bacterium]